MPDADGFALGKLPGTNMTEYGFPLRREMFAYLTLPRDLSLTEARRLQRFLEALIDVHKTAEPEVSCPRCGAEAGLSCVGVNGSAVADHSERGGLVSP